MSGGLPLLAIILFFPKSPQPFLVIPPAFHPFNKEIFSKCPKYTLRIFFQRNLPQFSVQLLLIRQLVGSIARPP